MDRELSQAITEHLEACEIVTKAVVRDATRPQLRLPTELRLVVQRHQSRVAWLWTSVYAYMLKRMLFSKLEGIVRRVAFCTATREPY